MLMENLIISIIKAYKHIYYTMRKLLLSISVCLCILQTQAQTNSIDFKNTIRVNDGDTKELIVEKAAHVVPSTIQLDALNNEFIAFVHFGPNTFTRMEWGNGKEDPKIFNLKHLDTDQWCKSLKSANIKMVILTVKHHDGFVLWQSRYTKHGIMSTGFKNGHGDILKELSISCKKYGLKLGIYLSPADLFQMESSNGLYGNMSKPTMRTIPKEIPERPFKCTKKFHFLVDDYNEYFLNELFELLTEYGPIYEVWFDGAHPKRKGDQKYNYKAWRELIRSLAPQATIFGREDVRWCGNEGGFTRDTEWNTVTYKENPDSSDQFMDMYGDLGTRDVYFSKQKPFYLHYQPAETNTSIREGWFYRDDTNQKVRSADNVFDIYERSVGGNSIFLLNIPPNRDGRFSDMDVSVLKETGRRINETYKKDLLKNAIGPKELFDKKQDTYITLSDQPQEIIISTHKPITFNRLTISEAIATQGERVEKHAVDAFISGKWTEISQATNIGYRRIHRFPEVTTDSIRIRILASRLAPSISSISAHLYKTRPPMLCTERNKNDMITIKPTQDNFNWRDYNDQNKNAKENNHIKIFYTTDGTRPNSHSNKYTEPFPMEKGILKAIAIQDNKKGSICEKRFGLSKRLWKPLDTSSKDTAYAESKAFDEDNHTYWKSQTETMPYSLSIDLGKEETISSFAYTPQQENSEGMIEEGTLQASDDGKSWTQIASFTFGNLINDPTQRFISLKRKIKTRYMRINANHIAGDSHCATMAELDLYE
jgi:alpha-L-fucosidase